MTTPKTRTAKEWSQEFDIVSEYGDDRDGDRQAEYVVKIQKIMDDATSTTRAEYDGVTPEQCKAAMELVEYVSRHDVQPCPSLMDHRAAVKLARTALGEK